VSTRCCELSYCTIARERQLAVDLNVVRVFRMSTV
jgi:hypothetical protein